MSPRAVRLVAREQVDENLPQPLSVAVYMAGLALGDADLPDRSSVLAFHEGLASLAEIGMFFALGLLVFPSQLPDSADKGLVLALTVAVVARPIATAIATWRQRFNWRERGLTGV